MSEFEGSKFSPYRAIMEAMVGVSRNSRSRKASSEKIQRSIRRLIVSTLCLETCRSKQSRIHWSRKWSSNITAFISYKCGRLSKPQRLYDSTLLLLNVTTSMVTALIICVSGVGRWFRRRRASWNWHTGVLKPKLKFIVGVMSHLTGLIVAGSENKLES